MCGYVVAFVKNPEQIFPQATLDAMDGAIRHRGPDQHGQIRLDSVSIGHRRLAVVDLVGGKQPMVSADSRFVLAYNGEIYNHRAVRRELESLGHRFIEQSDTEVLLVAWQRWGADCLARLNGMFTFVIFDRSTMELTAARDRFGEKPLYFLERDDGIYFASELKALVAAGLVEKQIDPAALYSYFTLGYVVGEQSIFRGVRRLLPGHLLDYSEKSGARQRAWWRPPPPTEELLHEQSVTAQALNILRDSVAMQMVADVPAGIFLSGGVDSSSIVALAAEAASRPVETFCIGFDDPRLDERANARFVAERFGTHHHEFVVGPQNLDALEEIAWHVDEPFADQAALPTWFLAQQTRKHVTVALSGDGGDEMFAGYDVYRSHEISERVRKIPAPIRRGAVRALRATAHIGAAGHDRLRLARNIEDAGLPATERFIAKQQQVFRSSFLHSASPFFGQSATGSFDSRIFAPLHEPAGSPLGAIAHWQQTTSLPDDMLHKVDRSTMAHSLEVRAPLLDYRLAELMNRVSFKVKLPQGKQKYILRQAMAAYFPRDFLWRPKQGFEVPLARWFKGDLQSFMRGRLLAPDAVSRAVLPSSVVDGILRDHAEGRRNWDKAMWALLMFEQWCGAYGVTADCVPFPHAKAAC
jgi:asparagine synthase (glutamine-hydrolysing)